MQSFAYRLGAIRPLSEDLDRLGLTGQTLDKNIGSLSEPLTETTKRLQRPAERPITVKKRSALITTWKNRRNRTESQDPAPKTNDRVSNLMEEVQTLVSGIQKSNQEEMIKSYANAALVADALSDKFLAMAEAIAEGLDGQTAGSDEQSAIEGLAGLSEEFEAIAQEAADSAEALQGAVEQKVFAEEVDVGKVEEHFKEMMSAILDGCEIYAGLTEEEKGESEEGGSSKGGESKGGSSKGGSSKGGSKGGDSKGGSSKGNPFAKKEESAPAGFRWRRQG